MRRRDGALEKQEEACWITQIVLEAHEVIEPQKVSSHTQNKYQREAAMGSWLDSDKEASGADDRETQQDPEPIQIAFCFANKEKQEGDWDWVSGQDATIESEEIGPEKPKILFKGIKFIKVKGDFQSKQNDSRTSIVI